MLGGNPGSVRLDKNIAALGCSAEPDGKTDYRELSADRDATTGTQALRYGREGGEGGREPKESDQKQRKPTETQGPCPDLSGNLRRSPCRNEQHGRVELFRPRLVETSGQSGGGRGATMLAF